MNKEFIGKNKDTIYLSLALISIVIYIIGSVYFFKHSNKDEDNNRKYIIYTIYGIITGIGLLLYVAALYD